MVFRTRPVAFAPSSASQSDIRSGGEVHVARVDALATVDAFEIAIRPAVDVVADDDLIARPGEFGDGRGRRRPGREGDPVCAALEGRDRPLEAFAGRVLRARVLVATARVADAILGVSRCLVDRRRDRSGEFVWFGTGVDRKGRKGQVGHGRGRLRRRRGGCGDVAHPRHVTHGTGLIGASPGGLDAGGQPSSSNTSSSPSMSSIWTPTCLKPRPVTIASDGTLPGETDARKRSTSFA